MLPRLLDHLRWADQRTAASLRSLDDPDADMARTWGHLLAAEAVWIARIEGVEPEVAVWPTLDLDECDVLAQRNHDAFTRYAEEHADAARDRSVIYRNSRGETFSNTVAEILHHVAMHGMYHRGQVAQSIRRAGGTPLSTDLIVYLRTG